VTPTTEGRAGFTLLEMLTVIFVMSIVFTFGGTILLAALRVDQAGAATLRFLAWRAELADQFRADVGGADSTPERLGELSRSPQCLILHWSDGTHVIYQWDGEQRLQRIVRTANGETRRELPVGNSKVSVEFVRGDGARPLITLRLLEATHGGWTRNVELSAALGGDLR
jgi:prepilin-type N-terminal cleavage/methylation domain-containing protein